MYKYTNIMLKIVVLVLCVALCYGQNVKPPLQDPIEEATKYQNLVAAKIGNFSIEMLFHTSKSLRDEKNFIISPINVWGVLAVMAEGAADRTLQELNILLRLKKKQQDATRIGFRSITRQQVSSDTVNLSILNAILVDKDRLPIIDFQDIAIDNYRTQMIIVDFKKSVKSANLLNRYIANYTQGKVTNLINPSDFENSQMVFTSALYFKGQWTVPFSASSTAKVPFYDSNGQKSGDVNMMYNRHTFPFSNIPDLQAKVIELSYGNENRLSMLIMLPNPGVSIENMITKFATVNIDTLFEELRVSIEDSDYVVDCFIPRFKIKSSIDLQPVLSTRMGVTDLFVQSRAQLPYMSRSLLFVSKATHVAEIDVTEEGIKAATETTEDVSNKKVVQFQANRPFAYFIIEKVTHSIVFGGFYETPSLY